MSYFSASRTTKLLTYMIFVFTQSNMLMTGKSDSSLVATRPSAVAAVTGIKAVVAKSKTEWTIKTSELIGVTCQPGFKGNRKKSFHPNKVIFDFYFL